MGIADTAASRLRTRLGLLACGALCACGHLPLLCESADPLTADEHLRLGSAYEAKGLRDDAARQYQRAIRLAPADPEAWLALGNIEFARGDLPRAEDDFRRALSLSPRHAGAQNNLAMAYLAQNKNLPETERLAKAALRENDPLRPYVLDTLANVYERQQRWPEARAAAAAAAAAAASRGIALPPQPMGKRTAELR